MTTTDPSATPEPPDLAAIHARAERHARLERDAGRDITLAQISAAISSADDVPALLAEVRRLRRSPRLIREAAILRQSADRAEAAGSPDAIVATLRRRADELDPPGPVLGRALIDANGVVWRQHGEDDWRCSGTTKAPGISRTRKYVDGGGPVRRVLLVSPEAGALLRKAARLLREVPAPLDLTADRLADYLAAMVEAVEEATDEH